MAIRNTDGTIYKTSGSLSQLIPDSPTNELFNKWDQETIHLGGSPVLYYEVFIPRSGIDNLYIESRNKMWSQTPVELFAVYEPIPSQLNQGLFGIDGPDVLVLSVNYTEIVDTLGHLPIIGSRIFTPHLRENWEIIDRKLGDFYRWKVYSLQIHCQRFQETLTTGEGRVSQGPPPTPSFGID